LLLLGDLVDQALALEGGSDVLQSLALHLPEAGSESVCQQSVNREAARFAPRETLTDLALSASGLGTHVRQEGDVIHLDETLVDLGFVGEDVKTGRVELCGGSVHSSAPERKHIIKISWERATGSPCR
jgi:hypothetical protein